MTQAAQLAQYGANNVGLSFKNRIINGDMGIAQRGTGSVTNDAAQNLYPVDRFIIYGNVSSKFTAQQNAGSVTPPVGFTNYLGCTSSSAYTVGSSDLFFILQKIEGLNVADLGWGTASAQPVTLSFWARSSLTGTFGGSITNDAQNRSYPFSYTISAANTWEYKTITIAGDTTGTWLTTNGAGVQLNFSLGAGSTRSGTAGSWSGSGLFSSTGAVSVVGTSGATLYLTGVQLEKGTVATSFDYLPYGTELMLCQRYYRVLASGTNKVIGLGTYYSSSAIYTPIQLPIEMRASPTLVQASGISEQFAIYRNTGNDPFGSFFLDNSDSLRAVELANATEVSGTAGWSGMVRTFNTAGSFISLTAEL
jgi:hypothetical protein